MAIEADRGAGTGGRRFLTLGWQALHDVGGGSVQKAKLPGAPGRRDEPGEPPELRRYRARSARWRRADRPCRGRWRPPHRSEYGFSGAAPESRGLGSTTLARIGRGQYSSSTRPGSSTACLPVKAGNSDSSREMRRARGGALAGTGPGPMSLLLGSSLGRRGQPSDALVLAIVRNGPVLRLAEHLRVLLRRVVRLLLGLRRLCRIVRRRRQLRPDHTRRRGHRHAHYQDPNIHGVSLSLNAEPAARPAGLRPLRP